MLLLQSFNFPKFTIVYLSIDQVCETRNSTSGRTYYELWRTYLGKLIRSLQKVSILIEVGVIYTEVFYLKVTSLANLNTYFGIISKYTPKLHNSICVVRKQRKDIFQAGNLENKVVSGCLVTLTFVILLFLRL